MRPEVYDTRLMNVQSIRDLCTLVHFDIARSNWSVDALHGDALIDKQSRNMR